VSGPRACDRCLQRSWLLGSLAERIEDSLGARPGGLPRELLRLPDAELAAAVGGRAGNAFLERSRTRDPSGLRTAIRGAHCWACCRHDDSYPPRLQDLGDPPAVLFGRGAGELLADLRERTAVTIVGARRPSAYGRELAGSLARQLASAGAIVVSGMALGIDSRAHEGALCVESGRTVAVLGGGAEVATPASRGRLYERIVERGLVLSELPPGTTPRRWTFPARNRIMAALSAMTVVVEARRRSGSLITAGMATALGREVGAVPGQVGSSAAAGTNSLLRDGAQVIRDADDVLDSLLGPGHERREREPLDRIAELEPELAVVLEQVEAGAGSPDAVARGSGLDADAAGAALVELELRGLVRSDSAGRVRAATGF
jgi:DNA processing protein